MEIKGLIETSFIDWPGQVCSVVFLGGCNFRCPFCHNHELVLSPGKLPGRSIDFVIEGLKPYVDWIDGVVVSGGEPTLNDELPAMCDALARAGFMVKLDTNGTRPEMIESLIEAGLIEAASMDLKAPLADPFLHRRLTGVKADLQAIRRSIDLLLASDIEVLFRTTFVPGVMTEAHLEAIAEEIPGAETWRLNHFRPLTCLDPEYEKIEPLSEDEAARLQEFVDGLLRKRRERG